MARHASRAEIIRINDLLREHLEILKPQEGDDPGLVRYKEDWDDKRIAAVVHSTLSPSSVAGIRVEMYGSLRQPAAQTATQEDLDRVWKEMTGLVANNNKQNAAIMEMQERWNRLVYSLHMKQVADVKHLCYVRADGSVPGVAAVKKAAGL